MPVISEKSMNLVYEMLGLLSIDEIKTVKNNAWRLLDIGFDYYVLFLHQCDFMIDRKQGLI